MFKFEINIFLTFTSYFTKCQLKMNVNEYYLSFFDILIFIPIGWGVYKGFINGFVTEAISLGFLMLALYGYVRLTDLPAPLVSEEVLRTLEYLPLVFFIIGIMIILFLSNLVERLVRRSTIGIALPPLNRLFGIFFGVFKYILITSCLLVFIDKLDEKYDLLTDEDTKGSLFYFPVLKIAPGIYPYLHFDNIRNSRYINTVKNSSLRMTDGLLPIGKSVQSIGGEAGKIKWNSYKAENYKDNNDLIIVSAEVENQDGEIVKTAKFEFLLRKKSQEVNLYSFRLNGAEQKKALGYKALKNGRI